MTGEHYWFDASDPSNITLDLSGKISQWDDISGTDPAQPNNLFQTDNTIRPSYSLEAQNGLNAVTSTNIEWLEAARRPSLGCAIVCCRWETYENDYSSLLGEIASYGTYPFHGDAYDGSNPTKLIANFANPTYVLDGTGRVNGVPTPPSDMVRVLAPTIYVFLPSDAIGVTAVGCDRSNGFGPRSFVGDYYEIMFFGAGNEPAGADIEKIEGYLAHKWGFESSLPVDHPYRTQPPEV